MEILNSHSNLPLQIVKAVGSFILERHTVPENTGGGPFLDAQLELEEQVE